MATVKCQPQSLTCGYNQMLPHFVQLLGQTDEHNSVPDLGCASDVIDGFKQEGLKQIGWVMHLHTKNTHVERTTRWYSHSVCAVLLCYNVLLSDTSASVLVDCLSLCCLSPCFLLPAPYTVNSVWSAFYNDLHLVIISSSLHSVSTPRQY